MNFIKSITLALSISAIVEICSLFLFFYQFSCLVINYLENSSGILVANVILDFFQILQFYQFSHSSCSDCPFFLFFWTVYVLEHIWYILYIYYIGSTRKCLFLISYCHTPSYYYYSCHIREDSQFSTLLRSGFSEEFDLQKYLWNDVWFPSLCGDSLVLFIEMTILLSSA